MIAHLYVSEMTAKNERKFSNVTLELTQNKGLQQATETNWVRLF
ncbi:hypothetical protein [Nostoc sp.]